MTFFEAVAKCYRKFFTYTGRASKREFWWFVLLVILFAWPLLMAELRSGTWYGVLSFVYFFLTLSTFFPLTAVWVRRMHDVGKSAWHGFYFFIPVAGFFIVLRWMTKHGDEGKNKYGAPDNLSYTVGKKDEIDLSEDLDG